MRFFEMNFFETLAVAFIVLKLTGVVAWPWWVVLLPGGIFWLILIILIVSGAV